VAPSTSAEKQRCDDSGYIQIVPELRKTEVSAVSPFAVPFAITNPSRRLTMHIESVSCGVKELRFASGFSIKQMGFSATSPRQIAPRQASLYRWRRSA
jgi:hypothetical protein